MKYEWMLANKVYKTKRWHDTMKCIYLGEGSYSKVLLSLKAFESYKNMLFHTSNRNNPNDGMWIGGLIFFLSRKKEYSESGKNDVWTWVEDNDYLIVNEIDTNLMSKEEILATVKKYLLDEGYEEAKLTLSELKCEV